MEARKTEAPETDSEPLWLIAGSTVLIAKGRWKFRVTEQPRNSNTRINQPV